ncbi:hypothetical protein [Chitinophaga sp. S165]|uniref:hypothetical protein n=1 Tax=Chitinophaga sp. S165 TaxID=2135462 RepID=UPI000D71C132|nr:hypothetical protein [Chitinophaga sp. S165]PWV55925.1 hypothetical protein C7475_101436 [Chitinophaga sp. S165]
MAVNRMLKIYLIVLGSFFILSYGRAQTKTHQLDSIARSLETYTDRTYTSLYIRTSKDIYESMEDLWFKTYIVDARHQLLSGAEQTLYVQLIHEMKDSIVWEEKYPVGRGIASGHIYLDNALPEGNYWLCAYSAHSLTADAKSFIGARRIRIVQNVAELVRRKPAIPYSDTLKKIQFSLLPEGGTLLAGVPNRVAFKAVTESGQPYDVSCTLFDGNQAIGHFKSAHAGMGSFVFQPQAGKTYQVRLDAPFTDSIYTLSDIRTQGMKFRLLSNTADTVIFRVYNRGVEQRHFYFRMQAKGITHLMAAAEIKDSLDLKLPLQDVPAGIAEATLFDDTPAPVAERLIYIKPDKRLSITATLSKKSYNTKSKISLQIHAADELGQPAVAQLGAVVYDGIYRQPIDPKDIQTHYLLSTQLKGRIYDPSYYFDTANADRKQALDLLLLTQGWRAYSWDEQSMKRLAENGNPLLSDSTTGQLIALKKKSKATQHAVMLFDADQRGNQVLALDDQGAFRLAPEHLQMSPRIYIKHFGEQNDVELKLTEPFETINKIRPWQKIDYPSERLPATTDRKTDAENPFLLTRGSIKLKEIEIKGRTETVFRDKYIGQLDSLAKYEGLTDRAEGGWLNCPVGDGDERPIEGHTYIVWTGPNPPTTHPFSFDATNTKRIVYHYPKFTEEELLKKFGLARSKGYYPKKEFYQPDYDKEKDPLPDYRNTLLWAPDIVTDENGNATLEFFSSDINVRFYGLVEGISGNGMVGKSDFEVVVTK